MTEPAMIREDETSELPMSDGLLGSLFEAFLVREGLELLAAFRSIPDPQIRQDVIAMVKSLAASRAQ